MKRIALHWEYLRVVYNLALFGEVLWALRGHLVFAFSRFWLAMGLFALVANLCYFLGPLIEICADSVLKRFIKSARYTPFLAGIRLVLFSAGLLFSMWLVWRLSGSVLYKAGIPGSMR